MTRIPVKFALPLPVLGKMLAEPTGFAAGQIDPTDFATDKQFCIDPLHAEIADCLREAEAVTAASSGDQTCLFVGFANSVLGFKDIVSAESVKAYGGLPKAMLSAAELWRTTKEGIEPTAAYFAKYAPEPLLVGLLECYLYFGTAEEARNAALLLLARTAPLVNLLQLRLESTPSLAWIGKRMQERGLLGKV